MSQVPTMQPDLLTTDLFVEVLGSNPSEDWSRTWVTDRTIMLRRTSERVKVVLDKMCLSSVVLLTRSFWDDTQNDKIKSNPRPENGKGKEPLCFDVTHGHDSPVSHHHTQVE